jgi:hypothetical protein
LRIECTIRNPKTTFDFMSNSTIKIGVALIGSRPRARKSPNPPSPVLSVDMVSSTFNVAWDGPPVEHWEIYYSNQPPGNFSDSGQTYRFPTDYWDLVGDFNVDWALYVVGCDADGNAITPQSNVLTGHSITHD